MLGYQQLAAKGCVAEIGNRASADWFAGFLTQDLVLADPGTRDALMHSIQCCVPDATLLPAGIERLYLADPRTVGVNEQVTLHAVERQRDGDTYLYDLDVRDPDGRLVERWEGLRLQAVRKQDGSGPWLASLLGPYLERRTELTLGGASPVRGAARCRATGQLGRPGRSARADRQGAQLGVGWPTRCAIGRTASPRSRSSGVVLARRGPHLHGVGGGARWAVTWSS